MVVFLCGTFADLTTEREAVLAAIHSLQQKHQAMELFGARPSPAIDTCLEEVRASDVLVVVIGFLYGSLVPGSAISYSEAEYHEGHACGKTLLVYLRDDEALLPAKYFERDPAKVASLQRFRGLLEERHTIVKFRDAADLSRQVELDLKRLVEKKVEEEQPAPNSEMSLADLMSRDLEIAAEIQKNLLPKSPPQTEGADIAVYSAASRIVGGDYYDFLTYDDRKLGIIIADVSGKSIAAALLAASLQARIEVLADSPLEPDQLVNLLNRSLCKRMPAGKFITFLFALFDSATGDVRYCNAGNELPLVARLDGSVERLSGSSLVLGLIEGVTYQTYSTVLKEEEVLLLYTDGLPECVSKDGEDYGEDRIAAVLRQRRNEPAKDIVNALVNGCIEWQGGEPPSDDLTLVVVRRERSAIALVE